MNAFAIGDSHIFALRQAIKDYNVPGITCLYLREKQFRPLYKGSTINRQLRKTLSNDNQNDKFVFLSIRGNHHSILGLVKHPVPFDFVLKENPKLQLCTNTYIIPYIQIREVLVDMIKEKVLIPIKLFSELGKRNIFYLEPPPPIPSDEHIKTYSETFRDRLSKYDVSPRYVRLKLWLLHSSIIREKCYESGIKFISVPKDSLDNEGFLKEKYWANDPTHANSAYGKLVVDQIESIIKKQKKYNENE